MKSPAFFWLLFALLPLSAHAQKGLVLYKDAPWDADQFVRATPYKSIEKFPTVYNIIPMAGDKIRVNNALVVKDIPFPTAASLSNISDEAQVKALESAIIDWNTTSKRYPSAAKQLKSHISQIESEIAQFRAGKVKVDGIWMTKETLLAKQQKAEEDRKKLEAKLEAEAKQLGMLTAEWATLDEAGRKRAREQKLKAEEARMRADEERRLQEEIEKQEKIAQERAKMKPVERLSTDTWITPSGLDDKKTKEYDETLKLVQEELSKAKMDLGFGKEARRVVLKTKDRVYAFKAADIAPEVQTVRSDEEKEKSTLVVLSSTAQKELIESYPKDGGELTFVSTIALPTVAANDVEKLSQGLAKIIDLCGGKREVAARQDK